MGNNQLINLQRKWVIMGAMFVRMCLKPSYQTSLKFVGLPLKINGWNMNFLLSRGPVAGAKKMWVSGSVASDQQIVVWIVVSGSRNRWYRHRWYIIPPIGSNYIPIYTIYMLLSGFFLCYLPTRSNHCLCIPKLGFPTVSSAVKRRIKGCTTSAKRRRT